MKLLGTWDPPSANFYPQRVEYDYLQETAW